RETCPPWRLASFRQMGRPSAVGFVPPKWMRPARSLADTKIPEDDIQNIFDVDASGQSPKSPARQAKLLADDILAALGLLRQRTTKRRLGVLEGAPVSRAGHKGRLGRAEEVSCMNFERGQKFIKARFIPCRYEMNWIIHFMNYRF